MCLKYIFRAITYIDKLLLIKSGKPECHMPYIYILINKEIMLLEE